MMDKNVLLSHIDLLHTTPMGINRIRKNLGLDCIDIVNYCKDLIKKPKCYIYKQGKNWYCEIDDIKITVNSYSYTIVTAHQMKK